MAGDKIKSKLDEMNIPLLEQQEAALMEARSQFPQEMTITTAEEWRRLRASILKQFDSQRDSTHPGWRMDLSAKGGGE